MIIAVDFDGTCVTHEFPKVGDEVENCVKVLRELVDKGHKIVLWTVRADDKEKKNYYLKRAVAWFDKRGIPLYAINNNPEWGTGSPKLYAHYYIDDAAIGCPLIYPEGVHARPYVNWRKVRELLVLHNVL